MLLIEVNVSGWRSPIQQAQVAEQRRRPPLGRWQPCQRRPRLSDQRLAHQADDHRVALVEAHALLQLVKDVSLIMSIAAVRLPIGEPRPREQLGRCSHLPHVHLGQARYDRVKVLDERHFKRGLLRRRHHQIELRAAHLRVVDLLDAVGALERCGIVPRLQQHHRVPDGADDVAEQRQVGAHVGLPDSAVAIPEEGVLLPQPLLLEEVGEPVEQRVDRRFEVPAHEHGGLAHVRRPLRLQPLAHGQPVLPFRAGVVELFDVAVDHVVLGELGPSRLLIERDLSVDLLHRVARQLRQQLTHAGQRHAQPQVLGQRGQPHE
eukprot:scaffold133389_cov70-Phaeocystis_antarctica.AAC.1